MKEPLFFKFEKKLLEKHIHFYELARDCHDLLDTIAVNLNQRKIDSSTLTRFQDILAREFQRVQMSYMSFLLLCDDGWIPDARTICRKLLESTITLKYLSLDPDTFVQLYENFGLLSLERQLEHQSAETSATSTLELVKREIKSRVEKLPGYERESKTTIPERYYRNWSGKNLHKMSVAAGLEELYSPRSFLLNTATHMNTIGSDAFFAPETHEYRPPNEESDVPVMVCEVCHYLVIIARLNCQAYDLKLQDSCDVFEKKIEKLLPEALRVADQGKDEG